MGYHYNHHLPPGSQGNPAISSLIMLGRRSCSIRVCYCNWGPGLVGTVGDGWTIALDDLSGLWFYNSVKTSPTSISFSHPFLKCSGYYKLLFLLIIMSWASPLERGGFWQRDHSNWDTSVEFGWLQLEHCRISSSEPLGSGMCCCMGKLCSMRSFPTSGINVPFWLLSLALVLFL